MSESTPKVFLARHGETEWSLNGRHTGRKDIPLTPQGEESARKLGARLRSRTFAAVFSSPLERARRTCELAGFGASARPLPDLMEWDYGEYEGIRSAEIHARRPDWRLFRDGCPGGEGPQEVAARADRVLPLLRGAGGDVIVFSHGHFLRMLAARWIGMGTEGGGHLALSTGSVSVLGFEREVRVISQWNQAAP